MENVKGLELKEFKEADFPEVKIWEVNQKLVRRHFRKKLKSYKQRCRFGLSKEWGEKYDLHTKRMMLLKDP